MKDGFVIRKPTVIHSRARARRNAEAKSKGRHSGYGTPRLKYTHHTARCQNSSIKFGPLLIPHHVPALGRDAPQSAMPTALQIHNVRACGTFKLCAHACQESCLCIAMQNLRGTNSPCSTLMGVVGRFATGQRQVVHKPCHALLDVHGVHPKSSYSQLLYMGSSLPAVTQNRHAAFLPAKCDGDHELHPKSFYSQLLYMGSSLPAVTQNKHAAFLPAKCDGDHELGMHIFKLPMLEGFSYVYNIRWNAATVTFEASRLHCSYNGSVIFSDHVSRFGAFSVQC